MALYAKSTRQPADSQPTGALYMPAAHRTTHYKPAFMCLQTRPSSTVNCCVRNRGPVYAAVAYYGPANCCSCELGSCASKLPVHDILPLIACVPVLVGRLKDALEYSEAGQERLLNKLEEWVAIESTYIDGANTTALPRCLKPLSFTLC